MRATTALAAASAAATLALVRSGAVETVDHRVGGALSRPRGPLIDRSVAAATDLGSVYAIAGASAVLATSGRRRAALDLAGAGLVAWGVAQGAKPLAGRARPYQAAGADRLVAEPAGSSWPSGHVAVATAMGAVVAEAGRSRPATAVGLGLASFVGFSRVYVGVHYPTDVAGGLALGWLSARAWRSARRRVTARLP